PRDSLASPRQLHTAKLPFHEVALLNEAIRLAKSMARRRSQARHARSLARPLLATAGGLSAMTTQSRLRHARAGGSFRAGPVMTTKARCRSATVCCRPSKQGSIKCYAHL